MLFRSPDLAIASATLDGEERRRTGERRRRRASEDWGRMSLSAGIYTRPGGSSFPTTGLPSAESKTKGSRSNDTTIMMKGRHEEPQRLWESSPRTAVPRAHDWPAAIGPTPSRLPVGRVSNAGPGATVGALDTGVSHSVCCGLAQLGRGGAKPDTSGEEPPPPEGLVYIRTSPPWGRASRGATPWPRHHPLQRIHPSRGRQDMCG